jgi:hypothetical protein
MTISPARSADQGFAAGSHGSLDSTTTRTGKSLRLIGALVMAAGLLFSVAGAGTWLMVSNALADERITVAEDAARFGGQEVNGPLTAYYQADIIEHHALEGSGGKTYAELDREDPARATVMNGSFLRASLFTSVVSFGVAAMAMGLGIVLVLLGFAVRSLGSDAATADRRSVERDGPDQLRPALRAGQRRDRERPGQVGRACAEVGQAAAAGGPGDADPVVTHDEPHALRHVELDDHPGRARVAGGVGQGLPEHGEDLLADLGRHPGVDQAGQLQGRREAQLLGGGVEHLEQARAQRRAASDSGPVCSA